MNRKLIIPLILAIFTFSSCSDDTAKPGEPGGGGQSENKTYSLSGKVEKGPFVRGSSINIQPLNLSLNVIGTVFSGEIVDDAGAFDLGKIELASQLVRITADGYYFNEIAGSLSAGTLHLTAYADLSDHTTVNVNILTHLKAARIQKLMAEGKTFATADKQAQRELLSQFGLQKYADTPAETMSVASGTSGSGVLVAISSLVLNDRSDAEVTQYLSLLSQDLAADGAFASDTKEIVTKDRLGLMNKLETIEQNIVNRYEELGYDVTVPDLRYFFDWDGDGTAGNEIVENPQVSLSQSTLSFDKNGGTASVEVSSNIPLYLEAPKDPNEPDDPIFSTQQADFFIEEGSPMSCETSYKDNLLTVTVSKTERRSDQTETVNLYDAMGTVRAQLMVKLAGDTDIKLKLSETGGQVVTAAFSQFANAVSWMFYVERGYTGMYKYYDVACPLTPNNDFNVRAFKAAYNSVALNARFTQIAPFFKLLNAITYTEMVDKWGNIGIRELSNDEYTAPEQMSADNALRYLEKTLDEISTSFTDKKADREFVSLDDIFDISKDVWRIAKTNVYMAMEQPAQALPYLQQIVDSKRYSLSSGNDYESNDATILHIIVPDEVMAGHTIGYYTYTDVLLMMAECYQAKGDASKAADLISQVANAKNINLGEDNIDNIALLRKKLFIPRYFAFQKRNGLGDYARYQYNWPIPDSELLLSGWKQNNGY